MKSQLILPDGTVRALNWTNRHPNQASSAGVVLFRHSSQIITGDEARALIANGGVIESDRPDRIRKALGFSADEAGIVAIEKEA